MTKKQLLCLLIPCIVLFIMNATIRPDIVGVDNYAFASAICNGSEMPLGTPFLSQAVFSLLPCNILFLKFLPVILMFACMVAVSITGKLINKENGWLAGFLLLLSPMFSGTFLMLEDDQLAFPLLFFAIYFMVKSKMKHRKVNELGAFGLAALALLFWNGAVLYFFAFSLLSVYFLIAAVPIAALFWNQLVSVIMPNIMIQESLPIVAFGAWLFAFLGVLKIPWELKRIAWAWVIVGVINVKFAFHAIPFLAIGAMQLYSSYSPKIKKQEILRQAIIAFAIGSMIAMPFIILKAEPTPERIEAVKFAIEYSEGNGKELKNDWDMGWWVRFYGGTESARGGITKQDYSSGVILTIERLNCPLLKESGTIRVYEC